MLCISDDVMFSYHGANRPVSTTFFTRVPQMVVPAGCQTTTVFEIVRMCNRGKVYYLQLPCWHMYLNCSCTVRKFIALITEVFYNWKFCPNLLEERRKVMKNALTN